MGRKDFNGQSLVENEKIEHKKIINRYHPEASICEQLVHLPKLVVYPDSWDMNKLGEMLAVALEGFKILKLISHYSK
ncbi:MAG: hypothetical protein B5M53_11935 [Candidatus Cloacimonas sp. 4484_209]|nr:MAG: hypothetical protein B5M53_11935 [Candidatus Cloacimonas sp. 4484_209]